MKSNSGSFYGKSSKIIAAVVLALLFAKKPQAWAAPAVEEVTVSNKEMDEALSGKKTYEFFVISADEFIDMEGHHISPREIKAYLKKTKPDKKAAYIFRIANKDSVPIARTIIGSFFAVSICDGIQLGFKNRTVA